MNNFPTHISGVVVMPPPIYNPAVVPEITVVEGKQEESEIVTVDAHELVMCKHSPGSGVPVSVMTRIESKLMGDNSMRGMFPDGMEAPLHFIEAKGNRHVVVQYCR